MTQGGRREVAVNYREESAGVRAAVSLVAAMPTVSTLDVVFAGMRA